MPYARNKSNKLNKKEFTVLNIIFIGLAIFAGLWIFGLFRGRKASRGYLFLILVEDGIDVDEANKIATGLGMGEAADLLSSMKGYANNRYGGRQLLMIEDARSKGFVE